VGRSDIQIAKLLLVDDEEDILTSISMGLERSSDFSVDAFSDPLEAYARYQPDKYDLAILDIRMPNMDGVELSHKLAQKDKNLVVCFLSAFDYYVMKKQYPELSPEYFINKPISIYDLTKKLHGILEMSKSKQAKL
jgi:DNA-binding response OmpR family regulator